VAGNFSTALAAHIFSDGSVVLSNAGHLPPYLDGQEVAISGALPLGAKAGTRYETMRFQMPRGSRLTFYSDGIVEAQDAKGELFGFERSRQISMEPVAAIVEAAKQCGRGARCAGAESGGCGAGAGEIGGRRLRYSAPANPWSGGNQRSAWPTVPLV
jgi:hypothetical protein